VTFELLSVDRTDSKTFTIVSNTSFPCSSDTADVYKQRGIVYRELTDLEKLELLTQRGGQFLPSYMGYPGSDKTSRLLGNFFPLDRLVCSHFFCDKYCIYNVKQFLKDRNLVPVFQTFSIIIIVLLAQYKQCAPPTITVMHQNTIKHSRAYLCTNTMCCQHVLQ